MPQIIEERQFKSRTSASIYTAKLYDDGTASCDCRGWTFKRPGQERGCNHTRTLQTGTVIKVVTLVEMARMALRGEQFDKVKQWTNGVTGQQMVSLRMMEQQRRSLRDRNSAREQFKVTSPDPLDARDFDPSRRQWSEAEGKWVSMRDLVVKPPKPVVPLSRVQAPEPTRAKIVFDEEV